MILNTVDMIDCLVPTTFVAAVSKFVLRIVWRLEQLEVDQTPYSTVYSHEHSDANHASHKIDSHHPSDSHNPSDSSGLYTSYLVYQLVYVIYVLKQKRLEIYLSCAWSSIHGTQLVWWIETTNLTSTWLQLDFNNGFQTNQTNQTKKQKGGTSPTKISKTGWIWTYQAPAGYVYWIVHCKRRTATGARPWE